MNVRPIARPVLILFLCAAQVPSAALVARASDVPAASSAGPVTHYRRGEFCRGSLADCNGFSCAGSPSIISDIVPSSAPGPKSVQIEDINVIYDETRQAGWLYRTSNGVTYIQFAYGAGPASQAFEEAFGTSGYDRRAAGAGNRYSGLFVWNKPLPAGVAAKKCVEGGELLAPQTQPNK